MMYRDSGKRCFDLAMAASALLVLSPIFIALASLVRIFIGAPVLFRQVRPGQGERPFVMQKFRTMTEERDADGELLPDAQRLTRFGCFLRASSLDELPELLAVIRGDMSLVGPRPLLTRYLPYYTAEDRRRFEVLPGITGWAQIHGRNHAGWDQRLRYDVWYVDHVSLSLDLKILARTILKVARHENVEVDPRRVIGDLDEERGLRKA